MNEMTEIFTGEEITEETFAELTDGREEGEDDE